MSSDKNVVLSVEEEIMQYTLDQLMSRDEDSCNAGNKLIYRYEIEWMEVSLTPCNCDYFYFLGDGGKEDDYKVKWGSSCAVVSSYHSNNEDDDSECTQGEARALFYAMIGTFGEDKNNITLDWFDIKDEYHKSDFRIIIHAHLFEKPGYIYNFGFKIKQPIK